MYVYEAFYTTIDMARGSMCVYVYVAFYTTIDMARDSVCVYVYVAFYTTIDMAKGSVYVYVVFYTTKTWQGVVCVCVCSVLHYYRDGMG